MSYNIYQLAVLLHNTYEKSSKKYNWNTQDKCKVDFDELPEANNKVMLEVAEFVWNEINNERKQGALEELKDLKNKINEDEINNIVWKEGAQYFETILDLIEERIKDLEEKE